MQVQYDNTFYSGEIKNKRGGDNQVNVIIPARKTRWKWPKKKDLIYYEKKTHQKQHLTQLVE